jgi:hypothetical protein
MLGLQNDALRTKLLETCKISNFFDNVFAGKSILERALELDEIYGSQKVEINLVQQRYKRADGETVCFGCGGRGHYKNNCPIATNKYKLASTSTQGAQSSKATNGMANLVKIRAVRMSEQMTGYCNVDGKICKFLADTGA